MSGSSTTTRSDPIRGTGTWEGGQSRPSKNMWRTPKVFGKKPSSTHVARVDQDHRELVWYHDHD